MAITSLRIEDFRNLAAIHLTPHHRGLNIICGDNGSGKTSLLEAIYYLGMGKSFRTASAARLVRHHTEKFSVFSQLITKNQRQFSVGVERDRQNVSKIRMDEKDFPSMMELTQCIPIRLIHSQSHALFESGPIFRRKFLDWGLFYHDAAFLACWRHFVRALKQRNSVLRHKSPKSELSIWTNELAKHALCMDQMRHDYLQLFQPIVLNIAQSLLSFSKFTIKYDAGWDKTQDYTAILEENSYAEYALGHTQYGPHRADFDVLIDDAPARHFLSRGQQKLLVCAMIVAQGILLEKYANQHSIYLVDDLPSELDGYSKQKLISLLLQQDAQLFITSINSNTICECTHTSNVPMKVFHVEQGSIIEPLSHVL